MTAKQGQAGQWYTQCYRDVNLLVWKYMERRMGFIVAHMISHQPEDTVTQY